MNPNLGKQFQKKPKPIKQRPWNEAERENYAAGNRLRAQTIPAKRKSGPSKKEWE